MFEVRRLDEAMAPALGELFSALRQGGDEAFFHPHPLTDVEAAARASYRGDDLYYVLVDGSRILGYGFLRGWDAGYEVPSLGIAIHPDQRGCGLGRMFMHVLHAAAFRRGASRIRLTVAAENHAARSLYEELGYVLEPTGEGQFVGFLTIGRSSLSPQTLNQGRA